MTNHSWLLSPLMTSVFFVLGVALFFQVIMQMLALNYAKTEWSVTTFERIQRIISILYFGIIAVILEVNSFHNVGSGGFVNFRILLVIYIMAYLGQVEGLSVLMISLISYITLRGISANTPVFIAIFLGGYVIFAYFVKLLQLKKIKMLTWLISVNVVVIAYWFWLSGGTFTNTNMWYQIFAFMITSGCLSFELTQIMTDNNEIIMISRQARTDYLTGLKNDGAFTKDLSYAIENAGNDGNSLHLMALDIDHFKMINDQHGHLAGNKILSFVGWSFKQITNGIPGVECYRVGGEEFDIIFRNVHIHDVEEIAREINQQIQIAEIEYKGVSIPITVSIGIATKHANDNSDDLYERADKMLYESKRNGRNRITSDND